jgi:hypothetical protein
MKIKLIAFVLFLLASTSICLGQNRRSGAEKEFKLLATTKTSTMQKELNQASTQGFRVIVGSPTSGSEMVVFLSRDGTAKEPFRYKLIATRRTGTMQKELNELADDGYRLIPSTMIAKEQLFGGIEIVMIMELPPKVKRKYQYRLLATNRTSTLQREVTEAKEAGYVVVGMVSRGEHMVVMERETDLSP